MYNTSHDAHSKCSINVSSFSLLLNDHNKILNFQRKQVLQSPSSCAFPFLVTMTSFLLKEVPLYQNCGWVMCPTKADANTMAICIFQQLQIPHSFLPSFLCWAGSQDGSQAGGESEGGTGAPLSGWDTRSLTLGCPLGNFPCICPDVEWKVSITY